MKGMFEMNYEAVKPKDLERELNSLPMYSASQVASLLRYLRNVEMI